MNLKHLSNTQLHEKTLAAAEKERRSTIEVLWHLRENEKRMLYAQMGYRDLKEYCVKVLKLSEGSAWRRINGMRTLQEAPEVEDKIQSGELTLTQIAKARSHFREVKASTSEKQETLLALVNQSTRQTERILAEMKPVDFNPAPEVREKPLKGRKLEITLVIDEELQNELEEIQILLGKKLSKLELLKLLAKDKLTLLKKDLSKKEKRKSVNSNRVPERSHFMQFSQHKAQPAMIAQNGQNSMKRSRYISIATVRAVNLRDQHQCQYRDPVSGRQCSARFHLQTEHRIPFAKGGLNTSGNLQKLCANHNRLRAVQQFGALKMQTYLPTLT